LDFGGRAAELAVGADADLADQRQLMGRMLAEGEAEGGDLLAV
jgi:hypothetical protein